MLTHRLERRKPFQRKRRLGLKGLGGFLFLVRNGYFPRRPGKEDELGGLLRLRCLVIRERAYKPDSSIASRSAGPTANKGRSTINDVSDVTRARITGTWWAHRPINGRANFPGSSSGAVTFRKIATTSAASSRSSAAACRSTSRRPRLRASVAAPSGVFLLPFWRRSSILDTHSCAAPRTAPS
jgi:hypothetical protein